MENMKKAMVIVSSGSDHQPALIRAVEFAQKFSLELLVVEVIYDMAYEVDSLFDDLFKEQYRDGLIKNSERKLSDIVAGFAKKNIAAKYKVVWNADTVKAINILVASEQTEIVIKSTSPHHKYKDLVFTPTDWNLLRHCPVPVLMVKEKDWLERGIILVAIDASSADPSHQTLNQNLLRHASYLAKSLGRELHVVHVYPFPVLEVPVEFSAINFDEVQKNTELMHRRKAEELLKLYNIPLANLHLIAGIADEAIVETAESLDAHLLVMGTVGRSGIKAAILGNTAEHTVDRVGCDVLTFKPAQYIEFLLQK